MRKKLTGIVVTGASGFIGRNFVIDAAKKYRLFCIARRSQKESGIPPNENIHWLHADISKWRNLEHVINEKFTFSSIITIGIVNLKDLVNSINLNNCWKEV